MRKRVGPAKAEARERGNETIPYHLERSIISILVFKSQDSGVVSSAFLVQLNGKCILDSLDLFLRRFFCEHRFFAFD